MKSIHGIDHAAQGIESSHRSWPARWHSDRNRTTPFVQYKRDFNEDLIPHPSGLWPLYLIHLCEDTVLSSDDDAIFADLHQVLQRNEEFAGVRER